MVAGRTLRVSEERQTYRWLNGLVSGFRQAHLDVGRKNARADEDVAAGGVKADQVAVQVGSATERLIGIPRLSDHLQPALLQ